MVGHLWEDLFIRLNWISHRINGYIKDKARLASPLALAQHQTHQYNVQRGDGRKYKNQRIGEMETSELKVRGQVEESSGEWY